MGGREKKFELDVMLKVRDFLEEDTSRAVRFGQWEVNEIEVLNRFQFLTAKEMVVLVNLSKRDYLRRGNKWLPLIKEEVDANGGGMIIPFSVEFEEEWAHVRIHSFSC